MSTSDTHPRGVSGTSTVILLSRFEDATLLPEEPLITAGMLVELSVGPSVARDERERAARQAHLQQGEADFDPLPFDASAARAFGRVAASLRRASGNPAPRACDAMIAAIAIANDLPIYTCNPEDFAGVDGLDLVAHPVPQPHDPEPQAHVPWAAHKSASATEMLVADPEQVSVDSECPIAERLTPHSAHAGPLLGHR